MDSFAKYKDYKTILSVNALIWCNGKILMLKRADDKKVDPGLFAGIGGKVEPHESFYDTLFREIEEETGITDFQNFRLYSVTQHPYPPTDSEWVNLYFSINISSQVNIESTKDGTFHWIDPNDVDTLPMAEDIREYIKILAKDQKAFIFGFFDHDKEGKLIEKKINVV